MPAADIYARVKAEFERLESGGEQRDWVRLANSAVEALMQCQSIVIEKQRAALEGVRCELDPAESARVRAEAKDALYYVDSITALYHRIKTKIESPTGR